jgi:hypothetical protein
MIRIFALFLSLVLLASAGCGGEKDTPVNRDKDRPKPAGA